MSAASRAVLSIAVGKPVYLAMAVNLARSFKRWHQDSDIRFVLATDQPDMVPSDLHDIEIVTLAPGEYGIGFAPKLHLDRMTPADRTLFVDGDCLCVGPLDRVFAGFAGRAVSVVGGYISSGEWFGDVASVCRQFGVPAILKFNGGVYYLERGEMSSRVYRMARELEPRYDEIGLVRLRGRPNDELLMAIAMAVHGQVPVPDDGSVLSDPQACPGPIELDVLRGGSTLTNPAPPHPRHMAWYPHWKVHPVLVHFLDFYTTKHPYRREERRLSLTVARGWPIWVADAVAAVTQSLPLLAKDWVKTVLRPLYRRLFGYRAIAPSERM